MGIDHSDTIRFKDIDEADVEIMLLNPFKLMSGSASLQFSAMKVA